MENQKKTWETPQLIVLGRGRPEEKVLAFCKYTGNVVGPYDPTQNPTGKCAANILFQCYYNDQSS